jgi:hypothetical protein
VTGAGVVVVVVVALASRVAGYVEPPRRDRRIVRALLRATQTLEIDGDGELQRRAEEHDHTRSVPLASLERLWERRDIDLRERTLWRLLYETAARADAPRHRGPRHPSQARPHALEGRDVDWLFFGSLRAAAATPDRRPPRRDLPRDMVQPAGQQGRFRASRPRRPV